MQFLKKREKMPFSTDLRKRVIAAVDSGMQVTQVAKVFKVSRKIIYVWQNLIKKNNSLEPKIGYQKGHSHLITDWDKFKEFANSNKECSSPQMIVKWHQITGIKVSESVMLRALKKIDFTSKKKLLVMPKQIKKNEKNS